MARGPDIEEPVTRNYLPIQPTPFIGHQRELGEVVSLLADPALRLLTILAPGGMGKTRLGLAAAEKQLRDFNDGVFFVPLAPLSSPNDIVTTIAEGLAQAIQVMAHSTDLQRQAVLLRDAMAI